MARTAKPGAGADVVPLNSAARKAIITQTLQQLETLEAERKGTSDLIRELKAIKIKGELGMKISDWNIFKRLHALEGGDRDELLATVREGFDALGVGAQLDWVEAAERVASGESKVPAAATPE